MVRALITRFGLESRAIRRVQRGYRSDTISEETKELLADAKGEPRTNELPDGRYVGYEEEAESLADAKGEGITSMDCIKKMRWKD